MQIGFIEESLALGNRFKEDLENNGHQVILYEGLQEAKSAILETRFYNTPLPCQLLIVDQEENATTLLRQLRLFLSSEQLPILLLSTPSTEQQNLSQELDLCLLHKPITSADLLTAVGSVIASREEIAAD